MAETQSFDRTRGKSQDKLRSKPIDKTESKSSHSADGKPPDKAQDKPESDRPEDAPPVVADVATNPRTVTLTVLATIALVVMLQYAQSILIPFVLGILIAYALEPLVTSLARMKVPRSLGAAIVLILLVGVMGGSAYSLTDEVMQIVAQVPQAAQRIQQRVRLHKKDGTGALEQVQKAANSLEQTAQVASQPDRPVPGIAKVQIVEPAFKASDYLYWGGMGLIGALGQFAMILFLVYFFLVTGDLYKRKIVKIAGPRLWHKKLTVQILDDINLQIASFMRVQILTSAIVAVATMIALWYFGLNQWIVWGLAAGIFNSIPYLGPILVSGGLGVVAFMQFDDVSRTLMVCAAAFAITSLEGFLLTPALMGRAARMNPVAIFVGLLFWSWIWGVWGAVLAVPMLMMVKAVCDHIEELQPLAELLGE
jgi:predicted PurR-regulated permease PerM